MRNGLRRGRRLRWGLAAMLITVVCVIACNKRSPNPPHQAIQIQRAGPIAASADHDLSAHPVQHVVMVSVDGLAARFIQPLIDAGKLPAFKKLQEEGAWTFRARTDVFNTTTLPNHTSMLTGLPVGQTPGFPNDAHHGLTLNVLPPARATLHNFGNRYRDYIPSVFDVAHDFGLRTCFFAGKSKFVIFTRSYDSTNGRADRVGDDNGRAKIDVAVIDKDTDSLVSAFERENRATPCHLSFVHLLDMDYTGHTAGWGSPVWKAKLEALDGEIMRIIDHVESQPTLAGRTVLLVTADHGGTGTGHGDARLEENFAIPFFVWGPGVKKGVDLYSLTAKTRFPPKHDNPPYEAPKQPIRNGDLGNLALERLGLPPIPGSVMFGMHLR